MVRSAMVGPYEVTSSLGFAGDDCDLAFLGEGLVTVLLLCTSRTCVGVAPCTVSGVLIYGTGAARAI